MSKQIAPDLLRESAGRWNAVLMMLENEIGALTRDDQAELLNKEMAPEDRVTASQWTRIALGQQPAKPVHALALSRVCQHHGIEVDPGWIIFGEHSGAPAPPHPLASVAHLILPPRRVPGPKKRKP